MFSPVDTKSNEWLIENQTRRFKINVKIFVCLSFVVLLFHSGKWLVYRLFDDSEESGRNLDRQLAISRQHPQFPLNGEKLPDANLKTILLWNSWFDWDPAFFFGVGRQPFIDAQCPVTTCFVSNQRYLMPPSEYDAILFFFPMVHCDGCRWTVTSLANGLSRLFASWQMFHSLIPGQRNKDTSLLTKNHQLWIHA